MAATGKRMILVTGSTGLQGGAVTRHLLANGWHVRALTRRPNHKKARALVDLGAEVVQGDMNIPASLTSVFQGAYGVFSVQNPVTSGVKAEVAQGKNVADAAKQAGIQHLVYSSAGMGTPGIGVPSWESKLVVQDHIKSLGLPLTVLRPMAFMELMTDAKFFPAVSTWHVMPTLMGSSRKVPWICVDDFAEIVAKVLAAPEQYIGKDLKLAGDVQSIDECRAIYERVMGRKPPRFRMPVWMFKRLGFVGVDQSIMWQWLRANDFSLDTKPTRAILPAALSVESWLSRRKGTLVQSRERPATKP